MLYEAVTARAAVFQLVGIAHADQVGRNAAAQRSEVGDNPAPKIRGGRVPVQKDDWVALAALDVGHLAAEHFHVFLLRP